MDWMAFVDNYKSSGRWICTSYITCKASPNELGSFVRSRSETDNSEIRVHNRRTRRPHRIFKHFPKFLDDVKPDRGGKEKRLKRQGDVHKQRWFLADRLNLYSSPSIEEEGV